ncbi:Ribonucleases P/MRP protein subunit pop1 [Cladochytrium tenue]|nr:Ribonucleases P/MRP protein subunit pop1 [Cladochytrium tenue]
MRLLDTTVRKEQLEKKPTEHQLNRRRSQNLIPGTKLPLEGCTIPILVVQRSSATSEMPRAASSSSAPGGAQELTAGWDLLVPSAWAIEFWRSLTFAGARAIGLADRRQLLFEAGRASFPEDYPECRAHVEWSAGVAANARERWERRPASKRPNYEKLGVKDPFESIFAKIVAKRRETADAGAQGVADVVEAAAVEEKMDLDNDEESDDEGKAWEPSSEKGVIAANSAGKESGPVRKEKRRRRKRPKCPTQGSSTSAPLRVKDVVTVFHSPQLVTGAADILASTESALEADGALQRLFASYLAPRSASLRTAFVRVEITMLSRGAPADGAAVYEMPDAAFSSIVAALEAAGAAPRLDGDRILNDDLWRAFVDGGAPVVAEDGGSGDGGTAAPPAAVGSLIGYVTTGGFSLARARGAAVACCSLAGLHVARWAAERGGWAERLASAVARGGRGVRRALGGGGVGGAIPDARALVLVGDAAGAGKAWPAVVSFRC